jgi:hypothetical protein
VQQLHWSSLATGSTFMVCGALGAVPLLCLRTVGILHRGGDVSVAVVGLLSMTVGLSLYALLALSARASTDADAETLAASSSSYQGLVFLLSALLIHCIGYPLSSIAALGAFSKVHDISKRILNGHSAEAMSNFWVCGYVARILLGSLVSTLVASESATGVLHTPIMFLLAAVLSAGVYVVGRSREEVLRATTGTITVPIST